MTTNEQIDVSLVRRKFKRGEHPNSRKNLAIGAFPKGSNGDHSHNGYTLTSTLKDLLHEESEFIAPHARPKDKLWREQIARAILVKSAQGDVGMVKELLDRVDGKLHDVPPPGFNDNRVINFILSGEQGKELIEGISKRLTDGRGNNEIQDIR